MTLNLIFVGTVLVGLALLYRYGSHFALPGHPRLPFELRRAELIYAEQTFQTEGRPMLRARVDRAYRKSSGVYVLVELKTRSRKVAFQSDVIELSTQRVALMMQMDVEVALYGYVLVQSIDGQSLGVIRVPLFDERVIHLLVERRRQILKGDSMPRVNGFPHLCKTCAHRSRCFNPD